MNKAGMQEIVAGLGALGLEHIPSLGNFVTFDCGQPGADVFEAMLKRGVIVRPIAEYGLPNHIRVSVGLPEENARFLATLPEALAAS